MTFVLCVAQTLAANDEVTAIKDGDLYTITSGVIKGGTILVEDGRISQIGHGLEIPKEAKVIDARGKIVMPGLVAATTRSMPVFDASSDKIAESLDPFHYTVSFALASGVTTMFVRGRTPSGRDPMGGTSAVIKPTYGDLDSMLIKEPAVETLNIGSRRWSQKTEFILKMRQARRYLRQLERYEASKKGRENSRAANKPEDQTESPQKQKPQAGQSEAPKKPTGVDPYLRLLRHEMPARLAAASASEILAALELVDQFRFPLIIEDAAEAWTVAEEIARTDVRFIITPRAKRRPNEEISRPSGSSVENAAILSKAGVKFAIVPTTPYFATWGVAGRDLMTLPMEAAFAVSGGLDEQTALEAITITAAEILGVADRVGSLQVGKDADIIILDGHPFHYNTFVQLTLVNGKLMYDKNKSTYFSHIRQYDDKTSGKPSEAKDNRRD